MLYAYSIYANFFYSLTDLTFKLLCFNRILQMFLVEIFFERWEMTKNRIIALQSNNVFQQNREEIMRNTINRPIFTGLNFFLRLVYVLHPEYTERKYSTNIIAHISHLFRNKTHFYKIWGFITFNMITHLYLQLPIKVL